MNALISVPSMVIVLLAAAPDTRPDSSQAPAQMSVRMAGADAMPKIQKGTLPEYPANATPSGVVDVETVVDVSGVTVQTRLMPSPLATDLAGACVEAIRATRFVPLKDESGRPMAAFFVARFEFAPPKGAGRGSVSLRLAEVPRIAAPAWGSQGDVVVYDTKTPGLTVPRVLRNVRPEYSPDAMRAKIVGDVHMDIIVLADGTVGAARVTKSLHRELDQWALIAARYWLFEPARLNGQAVGTQVVLTLSFALH